MWIALVPSGVEWVDTEIGGLPAEGVVTVTGSAGAGKTSFGLGFLRAQLAKQGRVCFLTAETPESVIEACRGLFELDLCPYIARGDVAILSYAPFLVSKLRSLSSADPPLDELRDFLDERGMRHVVFDTIDPILSWIDAASAKASVRQIVGRMQSWGRSVVCTASGGASAATELARLTSGSLELLPGRLKIRQAGWCNVYDVDAPVQFVQARGLVARADAPRRDSRSVPSVGVPRSAPPTPRLGAQPWMSLIGSGPKDAPPPPIVADVLHPPFDPHDTMKTEISSSVDRLGLESTAAIISSDLPTPHRERTLIGVAPMNERQPPHAPVHSQSADTITATLETAKPSPQGQRRS
jgi:KaiC/GvpD/RAD55 family RecA-like ATPase